MKFLKKPCMLKKGDVIATISLSGGRAGDKDIIERYRTGKKRLESTYDIKIVEAPNSLKGSKYLYEYPEKRAEDLMWAIKNDSINGIICNMGGDDSYRVLPYIDVAEIAKHPKVFMGYSDITTWNTVFMKAGIVSFYGPNILTPIAQPGSLDEYTRRSIMKSLFSNEIIGEITSCTEYTPIEWKKANKVTWYSNSGYKIIQGNGIVQGKLFGGCSGPLIQIMGTDYFPSTIELKSTILFLDNMNPYGSTLAGLHQLRTLSAAGLFRNIHGLITGALNEEEEKNLLNFMKYEEKREDLIIISNVDFIHRTPMTVLPIGVMAEINCEEKKIRIIENAVL